MTLPRDIAARLSADPELAARVALLCEGRPVGGALYSYAGRGRL